MASREQDNARIVSVRLPDELIRRLDRYLDWSKDPRRKRRGFRRKVSVMLGESVPQTP